MAEGEDEPTMERLSHPCVYQIAASKPPIANSNFLHRSASGWRDSLQEAARTAEEEPL
jgi:hypothetical protein